MNNRILLINPSQYEVYGKFTSPAHPPLGLAYLGAVLEKAGYVVKIIDIDADRLTEQGLINLLHQFKPFVVGLTGTTPTFFNALKIARLVKQHTSAYTIFGGVHATIMPEDCLKHKGFDVVVIGEGELTIIDLLEELKRPKPQLKRVKGIAFISKGKTIRTQPREEIKNLDDLPFPAHHLFNNNKYTYPDALYHPAMPIITSRGCVGSCTYCCSRKIFKCFRFRSAKNIVDEVEYLINTYGVREIHIWDDCYTLVRKRVFEVRDEILRRGVNIKFSFPNGLRVDYVDKEILQALKDMGTYGISFGVESGNQRILNNIKKGITLNQVRRAFKLAKEIGFEIWGFFMIGLPGDTEETIKDTINFAIELDPDIAKFHILVPFPMTPVYFELLKKGLILDNDWSKYGIHTRPVHRLPTLSPEDLVRLQKQAYRQFYLRPRKLIEQVLRLKTTTRLRLNLHAATGLFRLLFTHS